MLNEVSKNPKFQSSSQQQWLTYKNYENWIAGFGLSARWLRARLYDPGFNWPLVLFLAAARQRIEYKKVWQQDDATEFMLRIWNEASSLDFTRRQRVRSKVLRFFATTHIFPSKMFVFKFS